MSQTAFEYDATLTALVQEYGNCESDYVADCLFPRMNVCSQKFKWTNFSKEQPYKPVNDFVGSCSQVHEVNMLESTFQHGETEGHGLEMKIPLTDLANANCGPCDNVNYDLMAKNAKYLYNKLMLNREIRTAELALDTTAYAASDVIDLTSAEFNNATAPTDPLNFFSNLIACKPGRRPNGMLMSYKVWTVIRKSPSLLGNVDRRGMVSEEEFKAMFGLDYLCIADSQFDEAAAGLPQSLQDTWNSSIILFRRNTNFATTDCPEATFGFTAQTAFDISKPTGSVVPVNGGNPAMVMKWYDFSNGLHGVWRIRVGEYVKEVVADYSQACIVTNAILDIC